MIEVHRDWQSRMMAPVSIPTPEPKGIKKAGNTRDGPGT